MTIYLGIDPGFSGAVAVIDGEGIVALEDTPSTKVARGKALLPGAMADILRPYSSATTHWPVRAAIEKQIAMPSQSSTSTAKTFEGFGIWQGILVAFGIPYEIVSAKDWKTPAGIPRGVSRKEGKNAARVIAQRLYPASSQRFDRVMDGDRADAVLIAEWRRRQG